MIENIPSGRKCFLKLCFLLFLFVLIYWMGGLRSKPPSFPIINFPVDKVVTLFPDNENNMKVIFKGFSNKEEWGIWSIKKNAQVDLSFATTDKVDITICYNSFTAESLSQGKISVLDNVYPLNSATTCEIIKNCIPPLSISFSGLKPVSPMSLAVSDDRRTIALGLTKIKLNKTSSHKDVNECTI